MNVYEIARCPEHGLHGEREDCHECGGQVEQVRMIEEAAVVDALHGLYRRLEQVRGQVNAATEASRARREADSATIAKLSAEVQRFLVERVVLAQFVEACRTAGSGTSDSPTHVVGPADGSWERAAKLAQAIVAGKPAWWPSLEPTGNDQEETAPPGPGTESARCRNCRRTIERLHREARWRHATPTRPFAPRCDQPEPE